MAASGQYDNMDQAGVEQAMSNMMQSKGFQAMQECMDTIQNFAEEHPEAAEEIFEAMGSGQEGGF